MVLLDCDSRGKRCNGKMWTLKYSKKYWKNKGNKYKHCKERQLRNVAMTGWHRQLCPRKQLQDQQNYGPLFIWCSSRFPPSPAGIHPTQLAPRAIPHYRRKSTAFPSAPGHVHTLSPQLCPWICLTAKTCQAALHVQRSNLICTVRLDLWILSFSHLLCEGNLWKWSNSDWDENLWRDLVLL